MKPSFPQKPPLLVWASTCLTTCLGGGESSHEALWPGSRRPASSQHHGAPGRVRPPWELQDWCHRWGGVM